MPDQPMVTTATDGQPHAYNAMREALMQFVAWDGDGYWSRNLPALGERLSTCRAALMTAPPLDSEGNAGNTTGTAPLQVGELYEAVMAAHTVLHHVWFGNVPTADRLDRIARAWGILDNALTKAGRPAVEAMRSALLAVLNYIGPLTTMHPCFMCGYDAEGAHTARCPIPEVQAALAKAEGGQS